MNASLLLNRIALLEKECRQLRADVAAFLQEQTIGDLKTVGGVVPLKQIEKAGILRAFAVAGSANKTATLLGVGKTTVYRKLKEYGIQPHSVERLECQSEHNLITPTL